MINKDRIVPVQATDLLSLYGLILKMDSNNSTLAKLDALDVDGNFKVTSGSAPLLCSQPAETIDIDATASSVSSATIYFVPAYDYKGFSIDGSAVTPTGSVDADGVTLYKAALSSGAITIAKVGF
jgi:hypothetical protein